MAEKHPHEISFEHCRVWEGKSGYSSKLKSVSTKPETFLDKIKDHARKMRKLGLAPQKTVKTRGFRDRW